MDVIAILVVGLVVIIGVALANKSKQDVTQLIDGNWQFQFNPTNTPLSVGVNGLPSFDFPYQDGIHYLVRGAGLGKQKLQADFTISTVGKPYFDFHTNPNNTCDTPSSTRLYFQRQGDNLTGAGEFEHYRWWNTKSFATLADGSFSLTGDLTNPDDWISVYGKKGSEVPDAFNAAVANMGAAGLTFGGGCFFGHGVFVDAASGQATFRMTNWQQS